MRHSWKVLIKKITPSEKPTIMNVTACIACHRSSTKNIPWSTGLRDKFPKWFECEINQVACRGRTVWRLTVTGLKQMNLTEPQSPLPYYSRWIMHIGVVWKVIRYTVEGTAMKWLGVWFVHWLLSADWRMNFPSYKLYTVETNESNQANLHDLVLGL